MAIAAVDWVIFISVALLLTFLTLVDLSPIFEVMAGIMSLVLGMALYENVLWSQPNTFIRYGVTVVLIAVALILVAHGALSLTKEVR